MFVAEAIPEQPRTLALQRELADYENRGVALTAAVSWAEWVFVPRFEAADQPHRRWTDARMGFLGQFAMR